MWFEDMVLGSKTDLGSHRFEAGEISEFARAWYPARPHLEGRIAVGWHVLAIWMRLTIGLRDLQAPPPEGERIAMLGPSPGFLNLSWPNPVHAGEEIHYRTEVTGKIALKSRPNWGIVRNLNEGRNARGACVLRFTGQGLLERRQPGGR